MTTKEQQREWRRLHPEKMRERGIQSWAKIKKDPVLREWKKQSDSRYYDKRRSPLRTHRCEVCASLYQTRRSCQKYCSKRCQAKGLAAKAKARRHRGADHFYNSGAHYEYTKEWRKQHPELAKAYDRRRRTSVEYWDARILKEGSSTKGEKLWLGKSRAVLRRVRRLLAGESESKSKQTSKSETAGPRRRKASPSQNAELPRRNSLPR